MFGTRVGASAIHHAPDRDFRGGGDQRQQYIGSSSATQLEHIGKLRTKDVRAGTELRITVSAEDDLYLRAHSKIPDTFATAEIFGMELVMGHEYKIERGTSVAIFSWHGCTIEMRGPTTMEYDATNQAMRDYVNLAGVIEQKRQRAEEMGANSSPPRVLITGSENSGKSTLGLFLANYALRKHRRPIYVELDPGSMSPHRQLPSVPGLVSAIHIDHSAYELNQEPVHPNRINLHKSMDQGAPAAHLNPDYPIGRSVSFFYGYENWSDSPELYWKCIAQLSCLVHAKEELIESQWSIDKAGNLGIIADGVRLENPSKGGIIVNCPSNPTPELFDEIIRLYNINTVVVIEDEGKFMHFIDKYNKGVIPKIPAGGDDLLKSGKSANALVFLDAIEEDEDVSESTVDVAHVPRAGGVISFQEEKDRVYHVKFADYFHGPDRDLVCHNFSIPFRELFISALKPAGGVTGQSGWMNKYSLVPFDEPIVRLRHSILAVVLAPTHEEVVLSTVTGLIWVREISDADDPINATLHIMCPSAGSLMSNYLLYGDLDKLKYFEQ
jgi:hypothetical protein